MADLTSQDLTAIASVAVAVLAMVATAWQAAIAREHNRKSTMPILGFHGDHRDGSHIYMRNDGVGPAIIKEVRYFVDSTPCSDIDEFDTKLSVPTHLNEYIRAKISLPITIGVGHSVLLLTLKGKATDEQLVNSLVARVDFQILYESVYGEHFDSGHYST